MKPALVRVVVFVAALLPGAPAGEGATTAAADAGTCDRFTLAKVRLGMTRSEVEALSLGKIEVLGQTTDDLRLRVRGAKQKQHELHILIRLGRVQLVQVIQYTDEAGAAAALADLRARWGEPNKEEELDRERREADGRFAYKIFKWSARTCPAYGAYVYNSYGLYMVLGSSPSIVRTFDPDKDRPVDIR